MLQHVVITGASRGIGAALASMYSRPGTRLSLLGRDLDRLGIVADACRARGSDVEAHAGDVGDASGLERWLVACDAITPVDLVIANAGMGGAAVLAPKFGEPGDVARRIITINTLGVVNTLTPLLPRFVERRAGRGAIVSSLAAFLGLPNCPAYAASKAAIGIYGDGLHRLLAPYGVRITIVYAGFVDTPATQSLPFRPAFLWSAERAAAYIVRGIARGRREIIFPWQLSIPVRIARNLPVALADRVLAPLTVRANR
jgi:short-subunit dehydrogenase